MLKTIKEMIDVLKRFERVYFLIGFASRAQYRSLESVAKRLQKHGTFDENTLILYGGDDARNPDERGLGHLVALLKTQTGCKTMGVVCDRDEYESFIDYVVSVKPQKDEWGIVYTGYDDKSGKLRGNSRYYLHPKIVKFITHVYICGGGGFGLHDVKYVIAHTNLSYSYVLSYARYKKPYGDYLGPIYKYLVRYGKTISPTEQMSLLGS